jgi:hypothetical protein
MPYSQQSSNQSNNDRWNHIDEAISNATKQLVQFERLMNQLSNQSNPIYLPVIHAWINIPKPVGLDGSILGHSLLAGVSVKTSSALPLITSYNVTS